MYLPSSLCLELVSRPESIVRDGEKRRSRGDKRLPSDKRVECFVRGEKEKKEREKLFRATRVVFTLEAAA